MSMVLVSPCPWRYCWWLIRVRISCTASSARVTPLITILNPLYGAGLWLAVTITPLLVSLRCSVAKYIRGVGTTPRSSTSQPVAVMPFIRRRSEAHTSGLQSRGQLVRRPPPPEKQGHVHHQEQ